MAKQLATYVHVTDSNYQRHVFGPDDAVPDWAAKLITNPKAWKSDTDDAEASAPTPSATPSTPPAPPDGDNAGQSDGGGDGTEVVEDAARPAGNASREAWATYATEKRGIEVTGQMGREDIKAAVEQLDAQQAAEQQGA